MPRTQATAYRARWAAVLACTAACAPADPVVPHARALVDYPDCTELGSSLIDHACFHGERGPFGDGVQPYPLVAAAPAGAATAPNVNAVHTLFAVTLPGLGGGPYEGVVRYRPNRAGDWAILLTPDPPVPAPPAGTPAPPAPAGPRPMVPVRVLSMTGTSAVPLPVELQHAVAGCTRLPRLTVFKLTAGQTYEIVVGPSAVERVGLVFEKLADFEGAVFRDGDGDGHGSAAVSRVTACTPPAGFVSTDDDCDDGAAAVFPGARELCNSRDDDCDGLNDEGLDPALCGADGGLGSQDALGDVSPLPDLADAGAADQHPGDAVHEPPLGTVDGSSATADLAPGSAPADGTRDGQPGPPADASSADAKGAVSPDSGDGCGCSLGREQPRSAGDTVLLGACIFVVLLATRRRRSQAPPRSAPWSR